MANRGHPELDQWVDAMRGVGPESLRHEVEGHREDGCPECGRTASLFEAVAGMARHDREQAVPRDVEHAAKTLFLARRPEKIRLLPRILHMLVLDGGATPALAGVRALERASHQALYAAGRYALDLRLDQDPLNARAVLVGQIAIRSEPIRKVAGAPIVLLSGREVVAQASSNQFGEFQIEYEPRKRLRLCVALGEGRVEVPLRAVAGPDSPARASARLKRFPGTRRFRMQ